MRKLIICTTIVTLITLNLFTIKSLNAADISSTTGDETIIEQKPRKGVYLSGIGFAGYEAYETKKLSIGGGMRVGGGITEDILLFLEARGTYILQTDIRNILLFDGQIKGQYYVWEGFYFNLGGGVSTGRVQTAAMIWSRTKTGPNVGGGIGYEFRFGRNLFLAPEVRLDYRRLARVNYLSAELGGQLGAHF